MENGFWGYEENGLGVWGLINGQADLSKNQRSVVAKFATTASDGKPYQTKYDIAMKNEIILYSPNELAEHIEVRIDEETVWLSQQQMATPFNQTKQNISLHINNCFRKKELDETATVKESLTVQKEGNRSVKRIIEILHR